MSDCSSGPYLCAGRFAVSKFKDFEIRETRGATITRLRIQHAVSSVRKADAIGFRSVLLDFQLGPWVVVVNDLVRFLASEGETSCSPLAEADAMTVASTIGANGCF